jgi:hypothetical protein
LYWLRLYRDVTGTDRREVLALLDEADQLVAIFTAIVKRARANKKPQGSKDPR